MQGDDRFIVEWLTRAADDPNRAHREWRAQGVTLLRCGHSFAAVRIPAALVRTAIGTSSPVFIAAALPFDLGGPVIHHTPESPYYALIQWHAGLVWDGEDDTPCLAVDTYLGVPSLDRTDPPGPHWAVAPRFEADLCRPSTVRRFIARARAKTVDA
jgi:hypothetical protein